MLNTLSFAWVKNVYSLRTDGGTNGGVSYTGMGLATTYLLAPVHNSPSLARFIPLIYTQLSTAFFRKIPLLISWLYPQSTVPTIKRTKEI